jgi:hypothetical protein
MPWGRFFPCLSHPSRIGSGGGLGRLRTCPTVDCLNDLPGVVDIEAEFAADAFESSGEAFAEGVGRGAADFGEVAPAFAFEAEFGEEPLFIGEAGVDLLDELLAGDEISGGGAGDDDEFGEDSGAEGVDAALIAAVGLVLAGFIDDLVAGDADEQAGEAVGAFEGVAIEAVIAEEVGEDDLGDVLDIDNAVEAVKADQRPNGPLDEFFVFAYEAIDGCGIESIEETRQRQTPGIRKGVQGRSLRIFPEGL